MMAPSAPQPENPADLRSVHTSNLPELFDQLGISLIVSTYQAGKAIVVRNDNGQAQHSLPNLLQADGNHRRPCPADNRRC